MFAFYILSVLFTLPIFTNAFWMLGHRPMVAQRLDPIVNGDGLSGHVHSFVGSSAILGDQQNTSCTTAPIKHDRSRYWAPPLYYYSALNKTFTSVPLWYVNTYYLNRGGPTMGTKPKLLAFPFGLKMIAGNAMNFDGPLDDTTAAKAISFICMNKKEGNVTTSTLPNGPCPDGISTQIVFPSCWDGINLDSSDHRSHVAYPIGGRANTGDCPKTHPVKFMTLFYRYVYNTESMQGGASSSFVLANGDTQGYSFHADFIGGWNVTTLQAAADQCTGNLAGSIEQCPPFVNLIDRTTKCSVHQTIKEQVSGTMAVLPGCNPIRNGPFRGAGACQARTIR